MYILKSKNHQYLNFCPDVAESDTVWNGIDIVIIVYHVYHVLIGHSIDCRLSYGEMVI